MQSKNPRAAGISGRQLAALALLLIVFVGSIVAAPMLRQKGSQSRTGMAQGLVADPDAPPAEPGTLEGMLPKVTEASLFGLIGFALGYATRKLVKVLLIGIALVFLAIQGLAWGGLLEIDWSRLPPALEGVLAGVREGDGVTAFLLHRIPAGAGLIAGILIGFRRG